MITVSALPSRNAASSALPLLTGRCSLGAAGRRRRLAAEAAQDHVEERAVHRLAHDVATGSRPSEPDQRAGDDQHRVVQREADARRRPARVAVEHRDHHRHVGAADRDDDQHAQHEGDRQHRAGTAIQLLRSATKHDAEAEHRQRQHQVQHVLALEHDRRALEQAELVLARRACRRRSPSREKVIAPTNAPRNSSSRLPAGIGSPWRRCRTPTARPPPRPR